MNMDIVDVVIRSVIVYLFIVIAIRLFGKREISQLSVIDLVFILLISNSVQNAMVGPNTTLVAGIAAAATLFVINRILGLLIFKSKKVSNILEGGPIMLVYHGRVMKKHLDAAEISMEELEAAIREHGLVNASAVDLAVLEADGNISVLSNDFKNRTSRRRRAHKVVERES